MRLSVSNGQNNMGNYEDTHRNKPVNCFWGLLDIKGVLLIPSFDHMKLNTSFTKPLYGYIGAFCLTNWFAQQRDALVLNSELSRNS
jgi:hypothetical protein